MNFLRLLFPCWIVLFAACYIFTSHEFILIPLIFSFLGSIAISCYIYNKTKKDHATTDTPIINSKHTANRANKTPKVAPIYVFRGFERAFCYRIEDGYVYEGMSGKFSYRIENNKVYKGFDNHFIYIIDGNKIYTDISKTNPAFRIEGNNVYRGLFDKKIAFSISNNPRR